MFVWILYVNRKLFRQTTSSEAWREGQRERTLDSDVYRRLIVGLSLPQDIRIDWAKGAWRKEACFEEWCDANIKAIANLLKIFLSRSYCCQMFGSNAFS